MKIYRQNSPLGYRFTTTLLAVFILSSAYGQDLFQSATPPVFPRGEDAFIRWDKLPYLRLGVRGYMASTYDRCGNNQTADASHFLYQENDSFNVALDIKGPGILYFIRTNHFHGSPWHYEIDGQDLMVSETATKNPVGADTAFESTAFIPADLFPFPLVWTWTTTKGADLMWRPVEFNQRLRIAYSRTFYGTGYYIFHKFPYEPEDDKKTSLPVPPRKETLELLEYAGKDQVTAEVQKNVYKGELNLKPFEKVQMAELNSGPAMIRSIGFSFPRSMDKDFGRCRLRITWDHRWNESVNVPVDLFFGTGLLHNPENKEYLVKGLPLVVRYDKDRVYLDCYWPMPFFSNAQLEITEMNGKSINNILWNIVSVPYTGPINHVTYFHATYTNHENPEAGQDLTFLDTERAEGGGSWSGQVVGMSWIFSENGVLQTLEGDPRIYLDDSKSPQGQGTGTEEWGGGGDYWGGRNMTIPLAGHPVGKSSKEASDQLEKVNSAYRFLITDYFPFGKRAVVNLEHGGMNTYPEHYSGVVYWYGIDAPSLILTDQLAVFNRMDRIRHRYTSLSEEEPYALISRYNQGPDHDYTDWAHPSSLQKESYGAKMYFPAERDSVVNLTGVAQFRIKLRNDNHGLLIRRKFDYQYPNQEASVYVKSVHDTVWHYAGLWYSAGSNTIVHSRPAGRSFSEAELAPAEHHIITSNRRWMDDEFLVSEQLTGGQDELDIKLIFKPNELPLFPGQDFPYPPKWSASRYRVYCYVMPYLKKENIERMKR